jgi:hypothetical protein
MVASLSGSDVAEAEHAAANYRPPLYLMPATYTWRAQGCEDPFGKIDPAAVGWFRLVDMTKPIRRPGRKGGISSEAASSFSLAHVA